MVQAVLFRDSFRSRLKHPSEILRRGFELSNKSIEGGLETYTDGRLGAKECV